MASSSVKTTPHQDVPAASSLAEICRAQEAAIDWRRRRELGDVDVQTMTG